MSDEIKIQGQSLEVTVIGSTRLKDTEWVSRQDPYVVLEYGGTKYRTRTDTDGGKNPTYNDKFIFTLVEGLRCIDVKVFNSNTLKRDTFIASTTVHLHDAISKGFCERSWPLQTNKGRSAGEIKLLMVFQNHSHNSATTQHTHPQPQPVIYIPPQPQPQPQPQPANYPRPYPPYPNPNPYPPPQRADYTYPPCPNPHPYPPQPVDYTYPPNPIPHPYPPTQHDYRQYHHRQPLIPNPHQQAYTTLQQQYAYYP